MDWTLAPLVALALCTPAPVEGDEWPCIEYTRKPYVACMHAAARMTRDRRSEASPLAVCIRIDALRRM